MKRIILLLVLATLFASCGNQKKAENSATTDVVTVSILPQKTFVEKIAGDDFEVNLLIPPGSSPAAYTLLPSQLKDISRSAIWFRIGYIGFEHSWADKIEQANTKMKVVNISEGLDLIADKMEQHGDHVHIDGVDPHVWLSPTMVKQMAKVILDELSALKPEKAAEYQSNYMRFAEECDQLNSDLKNQLKDYAGRKFIVFHPSLSYFAREYGLEQYSLESGGKEPTPQHLREVVDIAKAEGIKVVYIQSEFDREHARVFADEIGGQIVQVWPLNPEWEENLRSMTQTLIDNFLMDPLIKIENLSVAYDKVPVLENVNLEIHENDFLGVIGPNGGGKTTLLKAILGLKKPESGKIHFSKEMSGRKKPIGYLPQVRHIDRKFPITVFDVVLSGGIMQNRQNAKSIAKDKAEALLEEMGVVGIRNKAIGELSGGQMQRVFLCRALLSDPKLLILDEPDTFVDNRFEGELYEKLEKLNEELAILLVSHDVGTITSCVKSIACVNKYLHYHPSNVISQEQLANYNCPIQIISHGEIPHTVLKHHHQ